MSQSIYFTTPIFYANGKPHAGHIYALCLVDILKKHFKQRGYHTRLLTGMDEHGEAVEEKAKEAGIPCQEWVDEMARGWLHVIDSFQIDYDVFQRTTDPNHVKNVKQILSECHKKGDIYFGEHEGHYCVKCESFLVDSELDADKNCLVHKLRTEHRKEGNYFFRTQKYKEKVRALIESGAIVFQDRYKNELLGMLDSITTDLSISRPKSRLTWGIELPFDSDHVTYVWFDALPNYTSGLGGIDICRTSPYWKNAYHIVGKDILKFHGIFWPSMCLSLDLPIAKVLVTGWLLKDGHKMSKSLNNVFSVDDIQHYGSDAFKNYAFRTSAVGEDLDINLKSYVDLYNGCLSNGIGNLASRVLTLAKKTFDEGFPDLEKRYYCEDVQDLLKTCETTFTEVSKEFQEMKLHNVLGIIGALIGKCDRFITIAKPWEFKKEDERLIEVLIACLCVVRTVCYLSYPFFPEKMQQIFDVIGEPDLCEKSLFAHPSLQCHLVKGYIIAKVPRLFDRIEMKADVIPLVESVASEVKKKEPSHHKESASNQVSSSKVTATIQDFQKISLVVGTVLSAEVVEGSDKLLKLGISLGDYGTRQVFSGIRASVKPEEMVNRKVIVVENLEPRKMRFGTSEGMVIASLLQQDEKVFPIFIDDEFKEGALLS